MVSTMIAVDFGGTQIRAARFSRPGESEAKAKLLTQAQKGFEPVFGRVLSAVRQACPMQGDVVAVGVGVPGPGQLQDRVPPLGSQSSERE
jgi:predicted NBD/HSP70 family sugar kinase